MNKQQNSTTSAKLNTSNPQQLIYEQGKLTISILGGIRLNGLDHLRVTLKIEGQIPNKAIRHNLDLYNDIQIEKLIRKTAERLEIGTTYIRDIIAELTNELENHRLQQIAAEQKNKQPQIKQLSAEETKAAKDFLKSPYLMKKTGEKIRESGVVGEETNRLIMYIIFTTRKTSKPLHIISLGSSGTGKSHLQEKVGNLIPEEDKIEITTLSENAFYYFGQRELKHKLILIEDLDGLSGKAEGSGAMYALRELQSKKKISKTVAHKNARGENQTKHLTVEGPVSVAGSTTKENIYEDNANRSFLIYLDESPAQDARIMNYQRAESAGQIDKIKEAEAASLLRNVQRTLKPITVRNPYAQHLQLPSETLKPRRTNNHYLQFIEAITFYHQAQRAQQIDPQTAEVFIETTLEDIAAANELLQEILLRKSDELNGACRNYLEQIKSYLEMENKTDYTNREIRKALRINPSNQKRYNLQLEAGHYIKKVKGKAATGYHYEIVSPLEYKQLKEQISTVLNTTLKQLESINKNKPQQFTGSKAVQSNNEPPKQKKTSKITQ